MYFFLAGLKRVRDLLFSNQIKRGRLSPFPFLVLTPTRRMAIYYYSLTKERSSYTAEGKRLLLRKVEGES